LKRTWGEDRLNVVKNFYQKKDETKNDESSQKRALEEEPAPVNSSKKPKLSKHSTMLQTAKVILFVFLVENIFKSLLC
jgi:hypothetical protein